MTLICNKKNENKNEENQLIILKKCIAQHL